MMIHNKTPSEDESSGWKWNVWTLRWIKQQIKIQFKFPKVIKPTNKKTLL